MISREWADETPTPTAARGRGRRQRGGSLGSCHAKRAAGRQAVGWTWAAHARALSPHSFWRANPRFRTGARARKKIVSAVAGPIGRGRGSISPPLHAGAPGPHSGRHSKLPSTATVSATATAFPSALVLLLPPRNGGAHGRHFSPSTLHRRPRHVTLGCGGRRRTLCTDGRVRRTLSRHGRRQATLDGDPRLRTCTLSRSVAGGTVTG